MPAPISRSSPAALQTHGRVPDLRDLPLELARHDVGGSRIAKTGEKGDIRTKRHDTCLEDVDITTPRDGTRRNHFQQDSTRFRGNAAETFGEILAAGDNQLKAGTRAIMAETGDQLPQVSSGVRSRRLFTRSTPTGLGHVN
ncbi:hypothetical protein VTK56DRAFT_4120 [Thermocarpiscus australiensis]